MAVTTIDGIQVDTRPAPGPMRRLLDRIARLLDRVAEGQMAKARAVAKPHLLALDDENLALLGHKRAEIARWESLSYWV